METTIPATEHFLLMSLSPDDGIPAGLPDMGHDIGLAGAILIDLMLYHMVGNLLQCYQCHSEYRDFPASADHENFDLVVHERHRQQEARLEQAPSVEHGGN